MIYPIMSGALRSLVAVGVLAALSAGLYWAFRFEIQYYRYQSLIEPAANRYQVPPRLIGALIWQETRFNPSCRGKAGELGLMQIRPISAGEWAQSEHIANFNPHTLINPKTNIWAGTWYLARAIRRWSDQAAPYPCALAEYNAGRSNALRWNHSSAQQPEHFTEVIDYPGTKSYIRSILKHFDSFGKPWQRW